MTFIFRNYKRVCEQVNVRSPKLRNFISRTFEFARNKFVTIRDYKVSVSLKYFWIQLFKALLA